MALSLGSVACAGKDGGMRYTIQNEYLTAEVDSFGAEIKSLKRNEDGREYMWHGDEKYWGRTSPVLFPFVGAVRDKKYRFGGKEYTMGQHGFARDMEFALVSQKDDEIVFMLESDETTMAKYPFCFQLRIGYRLEKSSVKVSWQVKNPGQDRMYFSIGAHPAFLCPVNGEEDKSGYGLRFGGLDRELHHHGNTPDGMAVMEDEVLALEDGVVRFTQGFFDKCTYMAEGKQTGEVSLVDREGKDYVTVRFDAPLFAVWSPEGKDAPFVCIEPWYGRCDAVGFEGELPDRDYENVLEAGGVFEAEYEIQVKGRIL